MQIQLEFNQRLGEGFQIRVMDGPLCEVYDEEPLTLPEAVRCVKECVDDMNRELGTDYKVKNVLVTSKDALESNAKTDITAARILRDALSRPAQDVREAVVDGEKQPVISGRGVILMAWAAWKDDGMPKAKDALRRYCEYISAHGYRGGASKAMEALCSMEMNAGARWIKRTFAQHVRDEVTMVRYVLPEP